MSRHELISTIGTARLVTGQAVQFPDEVRALYRIWIDGLQGRLAAWLQQAMRRGLLRHDDPHCAAELLLGEHDFSSFRAAACQALSPIKTMHRVTVQRRPLRADTANAPETPCYWRFEFEANAFLHHMIRNIMGCLVAVGQGHRTVDWMRQVRDARSREVAAPTFAPDGLYFLGPVYGPEWGLPERTPAFDWLP